MRLEPSSGGHLPAQSTNKESAQKARGREPLTQTTIELQTRRETIWPRVGVPTATRRSPRARSCARGRALDPNALAAGVDCGG